MKVLLRSFCCLVSAGFALFGGALAASGAITPELPLPTNEVISASESYAIPAPVLWVMQELPDAPETLALKQIFSTASSIELLPQIDAYITAQPEAIQTLGLRAGIGKGFAESGRMTLALAHLEAAWNGAKAMRDGAGKKIADFSLAHYSQLLCSLGRFDALTLLLESTKDRQVGATSRRLQYLLDSSREAYSVMRSHPGIAFRCGTLALRHVGARLKPEDTNLVWLMEVPSPTNGFSLAKLEELSGNHNLALIAARRVAGDELIVPSVVHWQQDHYAAIIEENDGLFHVIDPTFGWDTWMSRESINAEASGNFLIEDAKLGLGWMRLSATEAAVYLGAGCPIIKTTLRTKGARRLLPTAKPSARRAKECPFGGFLNLMSIFGWPMNLWNTRLQKVSASLSA